MSSRDFRRRLRISAFGLCGRIAGLLALLVSPVGAQSAVGKPFTVATEIGIAHFGDPYAGEAEALHFSPDGRYFAVLTERGRIDLNRPEDTMRIYRSQDVLSFLRVPGNSQTLVPFWTFNRSTDEDGPIISHWRWLRDSSGIAFLERGAYGSNRLVLADLKQKALEPLTPKGETIKAFDIRDRRHYVYAVADPGLLRRGANERKAAAVVGTGRPLMDLLFPIDQNPHRTAWVDRSELWVVVGDKPFRVKDSIGDQPLVLFSAGQDNLALSPDGQSLATALAVAEIPPQWERRYPPPYATYPLRLRGGKQDLGTSDGIRLVSRYARVALRSGTVSWLADGPTGATEGWAVFARPEWSQDGKSILLPDAFVASDSQDAARACLAVVSLDTPGSHCVESIEGPSEGGRYENVRYVTEARFGDATGQRLVVSHHAGGGLHGSTEYRRAPDGTWAVAQQVSGADRAAGGALEAEVKEGLNYRPVLLARDSKSSVARTIWDPNPQLQDIALGEATVYKWKDKTGREWKGVLFKPVPYEAGRRYPLVIQTHGFSETKFEPSGIYPTAFAARALAGAGVMVLQADMCPIYTTPEEGPCNVDGFEAAVHELAQAGLVDSELIGIIGFSRTCFHVMEALTTSNLHIKVASITDGVMEGYLQYLNLVDQSGNSFAEEYNSMIGAPPFGAGLQLSLKHSPLFNVDKVVAALQVVVLGRPSLTYMWEPYAAMRYLQKPVDLLLLNTYEHVLSNPAARLASQGGSVDWFRFWLQGHEDPEPEKAGQYRRWEKLCDMQLAQNPNLPAFCVRTTMH
jgi:dipeptidyl aminopeptidase/acylaminoacyl peptidase